MQPSGATIKFNYLSHSVALQDTSLFLLTVSTAYSGTRLVFAKSEPYKMEKRVAYRRDYGISCPKKRVHFKSWKFFFF
jgi:hypothetical protein